MQETQLNGESLDIVSENISKLKKLFPEIATEDKIDFEKLKEILGKYTEDNSERYNFTWKGKAAALRLAQSPSTGTLRPCKEESKNWDTTKNLYIEGDNVEVLKLLQKSYYGKIKMIYIDPPYNTGNEFVYSDDYKDNLKNYLEMTGQISSDGSKISTNTDASGRYHTNWLNMIYPRLRLARNLLSDDGVIFISIDDYEAHNLKKVCDEIFGIENFVNNRCFIWHIPDGTNKGLITRAHEYILVYSKNINYLKSFHRLSSAIDISEERCTNAPTRQNPTTELVFKKGLRFDGDSAIFEGVIGDKEPIEVIGKMEFRNGKLINDIVLKSSWRNKDQISAFMKDNVAYDEKGQEIFEVFFSKEGKPKYKKKLLYFSPKSVQKFKYKRFERELKSELKFENPKPMSMIKFFTALLVNSDNFVLDFFSGSGTTAHAIMDLNAEDKCNRKFIMVQLPEPIDKKSEAYIAGYENISEIGKERINRAGDKIVSEMKQNGQTSLEITQKPNDKLDIGFKVFKLDSSNLAKWDPEYDNLEQTLLDSVENVVPGRDELDLIYEIMLKYGIDLTIPIEKYKLKDKNIYSIGFGALMVCLENNITSDIINEIIKIKNELSPEVMRVVFKDNGFDSDSDKTNIKEILKTNGIDEFVTI